MKRWTEKEFSQWVYYDDQDGKIIGAVYKIGNSNNYARKSVELYWEIDSRTLLEQQ